MKCLSLYIQIVSQKYVKRIYLKVKIKLIIIEKVYDITCSY